MAMGGVINIVTREPNRTGASADVSRQLQQRHRRVAGSVW
jgi:outer membrane receptor for ferrienterochelin and colicin